MNVDYLLTWSEVLKLEKLGVSTHESKAWLFALTQTHSWRLIIVPMIDHSVFLQVIFITAEYDD